MSWKNTIFITIVGDNFVDATLNDKKSIIGKTQMETIKYDNINKNEFRK